MEHQVLRRVVYAVLTVGTLVVAGCGGKDAASGNTSVQGVVADGYLENAKVFLDLNDDKEFTTGEPTAMTAADGSYTINGVSATQLSGHALVVRAVAGATINHENGVPTAIANDYVLSTPPDAPKDADGKVVITPLTTLIHNQMETNPVLTPATAEAVVKQNLGVAEATSLFDDFVQKKGASAEYEKVSMVAQVVATAIGSNMSAITAAAPTANLNDIIKVIVAEVVTQLTAISSAVDNASGGTFDPAAVASSNVAIDTTNTTTLQATLQEVRTAPVVGSFQNALGTDGFFWVDREYINGIVSFGYGIVKLGTQGADGFELSEQFFEYDTLNATWAAGTEVTNNYALTKDGWVPEDDSASAGRLVFNADGTATWTQVDTGESERITVTKIDVAGKTIAGFVSKGSSPINPEATFPAGSEVYKMTFTRTADYYTVWMGGYPNSMLMNLTSVSEIPATFAASNEQMNYGLFIGRGLSVRFSGTGTSGAAQFYTYSGDQPGAIGTLAGSWKIVEPFAGYPVLVLDVPLSYRSQYMDYAPERTVFAVVDGMIRQGGVEYANVPKVESGYNFNKTAFDAILSNFNPGLYGLSQTVYSKNTLKKATKVSKKSVRLRY